MPLFMDVHTLKGGVRIGEVAEAHGADLKIQDKHDVRYLRYWVDEQSGKVFCLVDAPSAAAAAAVHREAHGLVADDVYKVQEGV
jgi:Protein of unknown function (DUF4242)